MLAGLGCQAFKIASGDVTHHALIARAARTGKPLIISTGMCELDEVAAALACARAAGAKEIALLHCVSAYPVPAGHQNLRVIATLAREFGVPVGLSDHGTEPSDIAVAVALGASLYEKHIVEGPGSAAIDAAVSATPDALAASVALAARVRLALGDGRRTCGSAEEPNRTASRRGLYAARGLSRGEIVTAADVVALRPAAGLCAACHGALVGSRLSREIPAGAPFVKADLPSGAAHAGPPARDRQSGRDAA